METSGKIDFPHDQYKPELDPLSTEPTTESDTTTSTNLADNSVNQLVTCNRCLKTYLKNIEVQNDTSDVCSSCCDSQNVDSKSALIVTSLIYTSCGSQDALDVQENVEFVHNEEERPSHIVLLQETQIKKEEEEMLETNEEVESFDSLLDVVKEEEELDGEEREEQESGEEEEKEEVERKEVEEVEEELPNSESEIESDSENSGLELQVYEAGDNNVENNTEPVVDSSSPQQETCENMEHESSSPRKKTEIVYEYKAEPAFDYIASTQRVMYGILKKKSGYNLFNSTLMYIHCPTCKEDFLNMDFYENHIINQTKCRCVFCGKKISDLDHLKFLQHIRFHLINPRIKARYCCFCKKRMFSPQNYYAHLKNMHPPPVKKSKKAKVTPPIVKKVPQPPEDPEAIVDDIKTYLFELPFDTYVQCSECSEEFQVDKFLDEHVSTCKNNDKFMCHLCSNHEEQDSYRLALCQVYQHFVDLRHIFKCHQCNHSFLTFENLKLHMQCTHEVTSICKGNITYATALLVPPFKNECQEEDMETVLLQLEDTPVVNLTKSFDFIEKKMVKVRLDIRINSCPCNVHCYACKKDFSREDFFETHIEILPSPTVHPFCVLCGNNTSKLSHFNYLKHIRFHFNLQKYPKVHRCTTCKIDYFTKYNRCLHMKDEHDIEEDIYKKKKIEQEKSQAQTSNVSCLSNNQNVIRSKTLLEQILQYIRKILVFMSYEPIYILCPSCKQELYFEDFFSKHLVQCGSQKSYKCLFCTERFSNNKLIAYLETAWKHLTEVTQLQQCQECYHVFISTTNYLRHVNTTHPYPPNPEAILLPILHKVPIFVDKEAVLAEEVKEPVIEEKVLKRSQRVATLKERLSYYDVHNGVKYLNKSQKKENTSKKTETQVSENLQEKVVEKSSKKQKQSFTNLQIEPWNGIETAVSTESTDDTSSEHNHETDYTNADIETTVHPTAMSTTFNNHLVVQRMDMVEVKSVLPDDSHTTSDVLCMDETESDSYVLPEECYVIEDEIDLGNDDSESMAVDKSSNKSKRISTSPQVVEKSSNKRKQSFTNLRMERWNTKKVNKKQKAMSTKSTDNTVHPTAMSTTFNNHLVVQRMDMVEVKSVLPDNSHNTSDVLCMDGTESDSHVLPEECYVIEDEIDLGDDDSESMAIVEQNVSASGEQYLIIDENQAKLILGHFLTTDANSILD